MPDPNSVVLPEHGLAFIGICKNANTAIKQAFLTSQHIETDKPHAPHWFRYVTPAVAVGCGLWSFAIVRDPWTRAVSCWRDKCGRQPIARLAAIGIHRGTSFVEFCRIIAAIPDRVANQHFRSQSWELDGLEPRHIGRFERLEGTWGIVQQHSAIELPLLRIVNDTTGDDPHTEETVDLIATRYAQDIERFGYVR